MEYPSIQSCLVVGGDGKVVVVVVAVVMLNNNGVVVNDGGSGSGGDGCDDASLIQFVWFVRSPFLVTNNTNISSKLASLIVAQ